MTAKLEPKNITALIDTREKNPCDLSPLTTQAATLTTGDYSILGLENKVALERKSLADLIMCVGRERDRFDKEVQRLLSYEVAAIFIEGEIGQIEMKMYRGTMMPNVVLSSVMGWMARGLPILFCKTHEQCSNLMAKYLYVVANRYYREVTPFYDAINKNQAV